MQGWDRAQITSIFQSNGSYQLQKHMLSLASGQTQRRHPTGSQHWGGKWWSQRQGLFSERKSFHANLISCFDELHQNSRLGECPRKYVLLSVSI